MSKRKKLSKKQENTLKRMKEQRQLDSNKLRLIIIEKRKWTIAEIKRGQQQIQQLQITMNQLTGILVFINDLIDPIKKEEKK